MKKNIDLTKLAGSSSNVSNIVTKSDHPPPNTSQKNAVRKRSIFFDEFAEKELMRLSGFLIDLGLKPLSEQRMIEFALESALNNEFDPRETYHRLKSKDGRYKNGR